MSARPSVPFSQSSPSRIDSRARRTIHSSRSRRLRMSRATKDGGTGALWRTTAARRRTPSSSRGRRASAGIAGPSGRMPAASTSTRRSTLSGDSPASRAAIHPPIEIPATRARRTPFASMKARTASTCIGIE